MDVRAGQWKRVSTEELMPSNCHAGEDSWEYLGDSKKIKSVNSKRNQHWIFIGRIDAEAEAPILWPPNVKNWLIREDPDAERLKAGGEGRTEDKMVGWHHQLHGHEFEQAPRVGDEQRSLAYCSPWGDKESDTTEQLNWTELHKMYSVLNKMEIQNSIRKKNKILWIFH